MSIDYATINETGVRVEFRDAGGNRTAHVLTFEEAGCLLAALDRLRFEIAERHMCAIAVEREVES